MKKISITFGETNIDVRPLPFTVVPKWHSDCEPQAIAGRYDEVHNITRCAHLSKKNPKLVYIIEYISTATNTVIKWYSCLRSKLV